MTEQIERLAKLEQAVDDHLKACDVRYSELQTTLGCVRTQIGLLDRKMMGRAWQVTKALLTVLILLVGGLVSYIWLDHVEHKHVELDVLQQMRDTDELYFYVPEEAGEPGVPPLLRK
jgi:hypothetical protein